VEDRDAVERGVDGAAGDGEADVVLEIEQAEAREGVVEEGVRDRALARRGRRRALSLSTGREPRPARSIPAAEETFAHGAGALAGRSAAHRNPRSLCRAAGG